MLCLDSLDSLQLGTGRGKLLDSLDSLLGTGRGKLLDSLDPLIGTVTGVLGTVRQNWNTVSSSGI